MNYRFIIVNKVKMLSTNDRQASDLRSDEDQDLLERSTKKPKKGEIGEEENQMDLDMDSQTDNEEKGNSMEFVMETPMGTCIDINKEPVEEGYSATQRNQERSTIENDGINRTRTPEKNVWSFREALTGKTQEKEREKEDEASDDDGYDEKDDTDECPLITLTKEEKVRIRRPWKQTLIIKVLGRTVGYTYLLKRLKTLWRPKAAMDLVTIENDYHLVRFSSIIDYEFAKLQGPWTVLDHCLAVKEWEPDFDPITDKTERLLVWVRFPCLPVEYYDYEFLMRLGEKIGKPKKVDQATSLVSRGKFARVCVEVDISKPLLASFKLKNRIRKIEYEGLHLVCFNCGMVGHRKDGCRKNAPEANSTGEVLEEQPE